MRQRSRHSLFRLIHFLLLIPGLLFTPAYIFFLLFAVAVIADICKKNLPGGRGKMRLAAFDGPSPKTPYRCKISPKSFT